MKGKWIFLFPMCVVYYMIMSATWKTDWKKQNKTKILTCGMCISLVEKFFPNQKKNVFKCSGNGQVDSYFLHIGSQE